MIPMMSPIITIIRTTEINEEYWPMGRMSVLMFFNNDS
jgi:hypothetical protein